METPADAIMNTQHVQLDLIAEVFGGYYERGTAKDDPSGSHRLVLIGSIDSQAGHRLNLDHCPRFTPGKDPGPAVLRSGDLLIPARGDRHDIPLVDESLNEQPLVASSFLYLVRPTTPDVDPRYLAWWLNQRSAQSTLRGFTKGTKIPFLSVKSVRNLEIPVPVLSVQRRIAEVDGLAAREAAIMSQLISVRSRLYEAVTVQLALEGYGE